MKKVEHCCSEMNYFIKENRIALRYSLRDRQYDICVLGLKAPSVDEVIQSYQRIHYCPWCGGKLPEQLGDRRCEELESLGYDNFFHMIFLKNSKQMSGGRKAIFRLLSREVKMVDNRW